MAPEAPTKPIADPGPWLPKSHRNPNRRALRDALEGRGRWIAYYSPLMRALAEKRLETEQAKPKEEQDKDLITRLVDAGTYTPYKRTEPKQRHKRGAIRRLAKKIAALPPAVGDVEALGPKS